jgi:Helix-turn-helix domain
MCQSKKYVILSNNFESDNKTWRSDVDLLQDQLKAETETSGIPVRSALFDLAKLRTARGVPQKVIAARLGLNASGVSRYEGAKNPRIATLAAYVEALGGQLVVTALFQADDSKVQKYLVRPATMTKR